MAEIAEESFNYNEIQQVHCLNAVSNLAGQISGTESQIQEALQASLAKFVPRITGSWNVAWGPAIYKKEPLDTQRGPENAWFAAIDDKQKICVVAVAGTAMTSPDGWVGDLDVAAIVPFDDWTSKWTNSNIPEPPTTIWKPGDPRSLASRGTCRFVHNILTRPSPRNAASPGTTIGNFLQKLQGGSTKYKICFTGHSLGGAVSPAVALGLVQAKLLFPQGVSVFPTAGASPGNVNWNSSFSKNFPPSGLGYRVYNTVLFNHLDVVPQAWSINLADDRNILNILGKIYTKLPLGPRLFVEALVSTAIATVKKGMIYKPLPGSAFTATPIPPIADLTQLLASLKYQHSPVYWRYIGIADFVNLFADSLKEQPGVEPLPGAPDFQDPPSDDAADDQNDSNQESDDAELQRRLKDFEAYVAKMETEFGGPKY